MLSVSQTQSAPPDTVWRLLVEIDAWPLWGPTVTRARLDDGSDRIRGGSTGTVTTPLGLRVPFVVTDFVEGRRWSWRVAGVPATSHRVAEVGAGTRVTFGVPLWAPAYLPVCGLALRRLDRLAGGAH